jgi:Tfp pilus assembly protein PilF
MPEIFEAARSAESDKALRQQLAETVASGYRWFAGNRHDVGDDEAAVELFSAALQHQPDDAEALEGRAESYEALGNAQLAAQDRARVSELRANADDLPRQ